jgi:predicted ATP-grasp superfamily ATP-dependent carboligase
MPTISTMPEVMAPGAAQLETPLPFGRRFSKVLLLDGYSTRTLACVRSWGKQDVAFAVGGESRWDMSLFSRYAKDRFVYCSPRQNVAKFIEDINRYSAKFSADCIFPTSEAAIMACNQHRKDLLAVPLIPSEYEIETVFSKANTLNIARSIGIAVPRTVVLDGKDSRPLDQLGLNFPVVIKSASSETLAASKTESSKKTAYVSTPRELEQECNSRFVNRQSVLAQEFIDGYGVGISGLFAKGQPVALIAHRRIRESDPSGGPSAVAEAIALEPNLLKSAVALLNAIQFTGPAMVEYRIDRHTGRAYLMEINGRFWGSILLASAAGLDLPYLYWKLINGFAISPAETGYREGIRGRSVVGDTKNLLLSLKGKPEGWPGEMLSRWQAAKAYLGSFLDQRTHEVICTGDDPLPFVGRLLQPHS